MQARIVLLTKVLGNQTFYQDAIGIASSPTPPFQNPFRIQPRYSLISERPQSPFYFILPTFEGRPGAQSRQGRDGSQIDFEAVFPIEGTRKINIRVKETVEERKRRGKTSPEMPRRNTNNFKIFAFSRASKNVCCIGRTKP